MPTILIVDDTAVDRRLAGGLLEHTPDLEVIYANDGQEALDKLATAPTNLVVTDLQMPSVDGLELLNRMAEEYPEIPVVLMTAHGSENVAAQALASGAASFVPKRDLAENLLETVLHVLALSQSESQFKKLVQCATKTDFEFSLKNEGELIEPLLEMIQQVIEGQGILSHRGQVQVGVALENAITNAMFRGNLELSREEHPVLSPEPVYERLADKKYADRRVYFRALITPEKASFTFHDEGPGFDIDNLPSADDPESFRDNIGRGLVLIQAFMDEVQFSENGRKLEMTKLRDVEG